MLGTSLRIKKTWEHLSPSWGMICWQKSLRYMYKIVEIMISKEIVYSLLYSGQSFDLYTIFKPLPPGGLGYNSAWGCDSVVVYSLFVVTSDKQCSSDLPRSYM